MPRIIPFDLSPGDLAAMLQENVAWFSDQQAQSPNIDVNTTSDF